MTNKTIIEKYKVILPEKVKSKVFFKDGTPQILTLQLAYRVIDEISELTLEEIEKEVMNNSDKWNYYKKLV